MERLSAGYDAPEITELMFIMTVVGEAAADFQDATTRAADLTLITEANEQSAALANGQVLAGFEAGVRASSPFVADENAAASLHKGDAVIVIGREHTTIRGDEGNKQFGRVIDADRIGADLSRATVTIARNARQDTNQ